MRFAQLLFDFGKIMLRLLFSNIIFSCVFFWCKQSFESKYFSPNAPTFELNFILINMHQRKQSNRIS